MAVLERLDVLEREIADVMIQIKKKVGELTAIRDQLNTLDSMMKGEKPKGK